MANGGSVAGTGGRAVASAGPAAQTELIFTQPPDGWAPDGDPLTTDGYIARAGRPGLAAEVVDEDGKAVSHGGDASLSGLLAYAAWYTVHAHGVRP